MNSLNKLNVYSFAIVVGLMILPSTAIFAQEQSDETADVVLPVEEIVQRVSAQNLDLIRASLRIDRAREELAGDPWYQESRVSVGAGYSRGPDSRTGDEVEEWPGRSNLAVPVVPQLSVGAGLTATEGEDLEQELSLTLTPFESGRSTYTEERALRGALSTWRHLFAQLAVDAEAAAYAMLVSTLDRDVAARALALEEQKYQLAIRRQEIGEASFLDVQQQQNALIDARQALFEAEQRSVRAGNELQILVSPSEERIAPQPDALEYLPGLIDQRLDELGRLNTAIPLTEALELAELDLAKLEAELASTSLWRPDLEIGATHRFPENASSVDLTLTFSPDQVTTRDISDLERDIEIARLDVAGERYAAELDRELGARSIEIARQALESARLQEEQDRTVLVEGELLFRQGGRTTLQIEQLRLNVARATIARHEAAINLNRLLGEQLLLVRTE